MTTCLQMAVFDIFKIDQSSSEYHVAASGPSGSLGYKTSTPPRRGATILVTIEEDQATESSKQ